MALRDKLVERAQEYLEPGEQVQAVFTGQTGPNPKWMFLTWITNLFAKFYVVVVTDRAIVALRSGIMAPAKPKSLAARYPRNVRIGPMKGLWGSTQAIGPDTMYIHKRFHKDVEAADAALGSSSAA